MTWSTDSICMEVIKYYTQYFWNCLLIDIWSIVPDTVLGPEFLPSKILYPAPQPFFPEITEFRAHKLSR